jgi:hypothetical protein
MLKQSVALVVLATFTGACGPIMLPRASVPTQVTPALVIDETPPAAGTTRVVLDVVDGPTRVELVTGHQSTPPQTTVGVALIGGTVGTLTTVPAGPVETLSTRLLCISPCSVDLASGTYELNFAPRDQAGGQRAPNGLGLLQVGHDPVVYRRSLGSYQPGSDIERGVGSTVLLAGALLAVIGTVALFSQDDHTAPSVGASVGMLVGGVGLSALGVYWIWDARPIIQEGAETQFPLR